jgi:transmembrane sensor
MALFTQRLGRPAHGTIDRAILEQAAHWFVQIKDGTESASDRVALDAWLQANEQHQQAWALVRQMESQLGVLPAQLAMPALTHPARRRQTVKVLMALLTTGVAGIAVYEAKPLERLRMDYVTAVGGRRTVTLSDGTVVDMNTDTAMDVVMDASTRTIRLHRGEILVKTGPDTTSPHYRRFIVETSQGQVRALGTTFSVRQTDAQDVHVVVFEHAVEVTPAVETEQVMRLDSSQQVTFNRHAVGVTRVATPSQDAWTHHMLVAVDQRLDDFLQEIGRYRRGVIQCDPAIADLRVTGSYRLDDLDASLESLMISHPVEVRFYTRFLVKVSAKV